MFFNLGSGLKGSVFIVSITAMSRHISNMINYGVVLLISFVVTILLQDFVTNEFDGTGTVALVAEFIPALFLILVLGAIAARMSQEMGLTGGARP